MDFNISLGNLVAPDTPPSQIVVSRVYLGDVVRFVRDAIEELGHSVTINSAFVDKSATNIFIERFYGAGDDPTMLSENGYRWGLIITEPLTTEGLYNGFEFPEADARAVWGKFTHAARLADFVWYLLEEAGPVCRRLNANSHHLPFGFVEKYAELGDPRPRRRVADLNVSGFLTERRLQMIRDLRARGLTVSTCYADPDYVRLSMLSACRATLSIQKSKHHEIFSGGRVVHSVMNRVPVIVEYDSEPPKLSRYCITTPSMSFVDECERFVRERDPAAYAQTMYDLFAAEMPMRPTMENIVEATFSGMSGRPSSQQD